MHVIASNSGLLLWDSLITLVEAALGFITAFVLAIFVGLLFTQFRWAERSFMPYLVAFQSVPIIAMAPLLVLWFGNGLVGKLVMAAIICFFPAVVSITRGLRSVSPDALTLMESLSATRFQVLMKLRVPNALPFVFAAMRISATLAVIGALVAEISGAKQGIGFRIVVSTYRTDTTMLFAALVFSILLGLAFYGSMVAIEKLLRWFRPFDQGV
jgi:NitT/TauT family transport system permease protein